MPNSERMVATVRMSDDPGSARVDDALSWWSPSRTGENAADVLTWVFFFGSDFDDSSSLAN
jgi:hypothetical protein